MKLHIYSHYGEGFGRGTYVLVNAPLLYTVLYSKKYQKSQKTRLLLNPQQVQVIHTIFKSFTGWLGVCKLQDKAEHFRQRWFLGIQKLLRVMNYKALEATT